MLIPKIEYIGAIATTLVTPNTHMISLKDSSVVSSAESITSKIWTTSVIDGSPNILYSDSAGDEFVFGVSTAAAYTVQILLTVTDSNNRTAVSTALLINDGIGNMNIAFITLNANVLVNGLTIFEPTEELITVLGTALSTSTPLWSEYHIDYENDGGYDDVSNTLDPFENIYTTTNTISSRISVVDNGIGILINILYSEVSFEAVIINPKKLIVTADDTCTTLTTYSETSNIIDKVIGRAGTDNSVMSCLEAEISLDCCSIVNSIIIPPLYNFDLVIDTNSYIDTGLFMTVGGFNYSVNIVAISIDGLNNSLISNIEYTNAANNNISTINTTTNQLLIEFLLESPTLSGFPIIVENNTIIVTTTKGFVYTIPYTVTPNHITLTIDIVIGTIIYPDMPSGVSITSTASGTNLVITPVVVNEDYTSFVDGIYTITLNDSNISNTYIAGCEFMDCNTYCLIINAIAQGCNPYIKILYDTLVNFKLCNSINCNSICETYSYLQTLLDECNCSIYSTNTLYSTNGCGC